MSLTSNVRMEHRRLTQLFHRSGNRRFPQLILSTNTISCAFAKAFQISLQNRMCIYINVLLNDVQTLLLVGKTHLPWGGVHFKKNLKINKTKKHYDVKWVILKTKGPYTLSPKFSYAFFVFVILSYQNACYGCKNAENRTRSDFFFMTDESFGGSV